VGLFSERSLDKDAKMNKIFQKQPKIAEIFGVKVDLVDYVETITAMERSIRKRDQLTISFVNVHSIMTAQNDIEFRVALNSCSLSVPDGMPLVWISKLTDTPLHNRVYGPDLFKYFCKLSERKEYSLFFYGGSPLVLQELKKKLLSGFSKVHIAGSISPPYRPLTMAEEKRCLDEINRSNPDVLWISLGCPKQEKWMNSIRKRVKVPVIACVGAAFDFHSGAIRQAPKSWQHIGLEWLFRLIQEPRRLAFRYVVYNPLFIFKLFRHIIKVRLK
jgi:exopolysaccharide biosynthesis WecB/TagA/CpsF family protein